MNEESFKGTYETWVFHGGMLNKDAWVWSEAVMSPWHCRIVSCHSVFAPADYSQHSRSCHSSAQNSLVTFISLWGKTKALLGPPKLCVHWLPGTSRALSLSASGPQHTHSTQATWNSLLPLLPARHPAVRGSDHGLRLHLRALFSQVLAWLTP